MTPGKGIPQQTVIHRAPTQQKTTQQKTIQQALRKSTEKVHITYSMWGGASEGSQTQAVADVFNASQDKIEVEVVAIPWENYTTRLNTMATANELPDTGMLNENMVIPYATNDMLLDSSSMYDGGSKPIDTVAFKYNGKTVAYSAANEILILYYNKDMFDAAVLLIRRLM
jgi:multiple sugar transport system substrate-binding protein